MELIIEINQLMETIKHQLTYLSTHKTLLFYGEMGAGKTTFIAALVKQLCGTSDASSPTYSIVNEYQFPSGKIFHFDLYRLKSADELMDLGFEEYVDSKHYCLIEWPEMSLPFLHKPYMSIIINVKENNRYLSAQIIQ